MRHFNDQIKICLLGLAIILVACSRNDVAVEGGTDSYTPLQIGNITFSGVSTRSSDTELTDGDIGIFRLESTGYAGTRSNVQYTNSGSGWDVASDTDPIYLTQSQATLCAYYPYSGDDDYTDGTVTLTSQLYSGAADLCYQTGVQGISGTPVSFTLGHAYSLITFNLVRNASYSGTCAVSGITIANAGILTSGTLDMTTGSYDGSTTGTVIVDPAITSIENGSSVTKAILMAPVTTAMNGNLTLILTVDGKQMSITLGVSTFSLTQLDAGTNYSISVTISGTGISVSGVTIEDWTDVPVGTVTPVTLAEESNCYMLPLGETVYIPVSRVATAWTEINGSSYTLPTTWTAGLLWTTSSNGVSASGSVASISYNRDGGYIKVTAGSVEGNSVVAIYDADGGNILWSWHIWTTNYNPDVPTNGTTYNFNTNNPLTFMDRNLGATTTTEATLTTMGLLYQWGRKDPFPGASAYTGITNGTYSSLPIYNASGTQLTEGSPIGGTGINSIVASATTTETKTLNLTNAIKNPMNFYYATTGGTYIHYDWYTTTDDAARTYQNDALWGNSVYTSSPTMKTIFDPCPSGWRVPTWSSSYSPWDVFGTSTPNAYVATSTVGTWNYGLTVTSVSAGYYPAAGYRAAGSGALYYVGSYGSYWSASSYSGYGFILGFHSSNVYPAYYSHRANGFSVRCVQE